MAIMIKKITPLGITLIKVIIHIASLMVLVYFYLLIDSGRLGADPVKEMIHFLGKTTLNYLLLTLAITPLCKRFKQPLLIRLRRLIGLYCFTWASLHVATFFWLELNGQFVLLIEEVVKRPYLTFGMLTWLILFALSITSINVFKRKMKKYWFTLHHFVYLAVILGAIHYYWSVKSGLSEPIIYFVIVFILLRERSQYFKSLFSIKKKVR